ncbi:MAG: hypothetical protein ACYDG2_17555 [Ruminiclostridium sp.]
MNKRNMTCFLLGFQRIFILIRSQIRSPYNIRLLGKISEYALMLKDRNNIEYDMFKIEILEMVEGDIEIEEFLNNALNNINSNFETNNLMEIKSYLYVLSDTAIEICKQLKDGCLDRAYDLVDAIHCLPEAIISKKNWNSKAFWNNYIKPYREKWDSNFLNNREKS